MGTGFRGTFVISWAQTETDGLTAAPLDILAVGATWRWTGRAVRVDGARNVLRLDEAEGAADIRKRAARMVRRLIGAAMSEQQGLPLAVENAGETTPEQGFTVTDGRQSYAVTVVDTPKAGARLLMFVDEIPPVNTELWIVRLSMGLTSPKGRQSQKGGVICFTPGTAIRTAWGDQPIETLRPGDFIATRDNGLQEILWMGQRRISGARLHLMPHLRPIRFGAGALGLDRPDSTLLVSPQHRMLIKGASARALFNTDEVLVAAEDLINQTTITLDHSLREITYIHVLLKQHQVIWANGLETESFHPANAALHDIAPDQRRGLLTLLPGLAQNPLTYGDYARRNLSRPEAAILRHDLAA